MTQISLQDLRGVFAPSFVELNEGVRVGIVASSGLLEDEEAEMKKKRKQLESEVSLFIL